MGTACSGPSRIKSTEIRISTLKSEKAFAIISLKMKRGTSYSSTRIPCEVDSVVTSKQCVSKVISTVFLVPLSTLPSYPASSCSRSYDTLTGTYGTHIELVVAANLFGRPINITQPGLIYVIDADEQAPPDDAPDDPTTSRRSSLRGAKPPDPPREINPIYLVSVLSLFVFDCETDPVVLRYHSWEHYSSVRNIAGPATGLPYVREVSVFYF